ncbi:MAG: hypothetical protein IMX02_02665 [Limnochordaceae bacterium]|nr:hypothetical protein [Limnochordaceae bacterium]
MGDVRIRASEWVLAVITTDREYRPAGAPVFYARDRDDLERIALYLCRSALATAHEVTPGTLIIMRH